MDKKIIAPLFVFILSVAFVIVCFLLFFNVKKFKKLIALKLKLGGLILSLSAFTSCYQYTFSPCYRVTPNAPKNLYTKILLPDNNYDDSILKVKFQTNAGILQNPSNFQKLSAWEIGLCSNFHKTYSYNSYYTGLLLKNSLYNKEFNGLLYGVNAGCSHLTHIYEGLYTNFFSDVDIHYGKNDNFRNFFVYGVNFGTKMNDFQIYYSTSTEIDLWGRYEFSKQSMKFQENFYIGIKLSYAFYTVNHKIKK